MLKFEFAIEAVIIFVKNIKKASSGKFTLLVSQLYELSYIYHSMHLSAPFSKYTNFSCRRLYSCSLKGSLKWHLAPD